MAIHRILTKCYITISPVFFYYHLFLKKMNVIHFFYYNSFIINTKALKFIDMIIFYLFENFFFHSIVQYLIFII